MNDKQDERLGKSFATFFTNIWQGNLGHPVEISWKHLPHYRTQKIDQLCFFQSRFFTAQCARDANTLESETNKHQPNVSKKNYTLDSWWRQKL